MDVLVEVVQPRKHERQNKPQEHEECSHKEYTGNIRTVLDSRIRYVKIKQDNSYAIKTKRDVTKPTEL